MKQLLTNVLVDGAEWTEKRWLARAQDCITGGVQKLPLACHQRHDTVEYCTINYWCAQQISMARLDHTLLRMRHTGSLNLIVRVKREWQNEVKCTIMQVKIYEYAMDKLRPFTLYKAFIAQWLCPASIYPLRMAGAPLISGAAREFLLGFCFSRPCTNLSILSLSSGLAVTPLWSGLIALRSCREACGVSSYRRQFHI